MKFTTTCTCGDVMSVDAASREDALEQLKTMMNEEAIGKHMAEKHQGQPVPSVEQTHVMIEQTLKEETVTAAA